MRLLNIGCGGHFHAAWTNIDLVSSSPDVLAFDVRKGLPFHDNHFDAVYHSHVIEHLTPPNADTFMKEGIRVLRTGGIMRIVVPDLEQIARLYLSKLEAALNDTPGAENDYDWILLELFDQTVRTVSGGEMGRYLKRPDLQNKEFILSRIGTEALNVCNAGHHGRSFWDKLSKAKPTTLFTLLRNSIARQCIGLVAGKNGKQAFNTGLFRESGENHLWMYDSYSLKRLMTRSGLSGIKVCRADESLIPHFDSYGLDVTNGRIRKPDSLFMEGTKA